MNHHEKSMAIIEIFDLKPSKVGEILGMTAQGAYNKMRMLGSNKFNQGDLHLFKVYFSKKIEKYNELL